MRITYITLSTDSVLYNSTSHHILQFCESGSISSRNIQRFPKMSVIVGDKFSAFGWSPYKNGVEVLSQQKKSASVQPRTCLRPLERFLLIMR